MTFGNEAFIVVCVFHLANLQCAGLLGHRLFNYVTSSNFFCKKKKEKKTMISCVKYDLFSFPDPCHRTFGAVFLYQFRQIRLCLAYVTCRPMTHVLLLAYSS